MPLLVQLLGMYVSSFQKQLQTNFMGMYTSTEVCFRIASAMARPNRIWRCNTISFASKFKLYKSVVASILLFGCEIWTLLANSEKRIQAFETKSLRKLLRMSHWSTRPTTGCGARSTPMRVHRNFFWQPSRNRNLHGSGMSHATTVSPKPSFKAFWMVGDAMVSRGNAGWTASKSGHPCQFKNCSKEPPAEKTGRGSLLNHQLKYQQSLNDIKKKLCPCLNDRHNQQCIAVSQTLDLLQSFLDQRTEKHLLPSTVSCLWVPAVSRSSGFHIS